MGAFDDLLEVQEHDSAIERLRVRRERLPERAELDEVEAQVEALRSHLTEVEASRDDVRREEKRFEDEVASVQARIEELEKSLYSGTTSNPKELQAMQSEVQQLRSHTSGLEDRELDAMERREELDAQIADLESRIADLGATAEKLRRTIAEHEAEIDAEAASERAARDGAAPRVPEDLLSLYEQIRSSNRGIGAAALVAGTCQACHLALPAVEVDRIKKEPPDALVRCEQCGVILVRP